MTEGRQLWVRAEEMGFVHGWTYDHLAWRSLRDSPWFGATPLLAAAAAVTRRMGLGTLVASPNFRHPAVLARDVLAIDDISGGRFVLGIGAGGEGWDAVMLGEESLSLRQRADRFAEFVVLMDRLLTDREVDHSGEWFSALGARSYPGCVQQPRTPFAIAATGRRGFALAARYAETWVTTGDRGAASLDVEAGVAVVRRQTEQVEKACLEAGRDPTTIKRLVLAGAGLAAGLSSRDAFEHTIGSYAAAGVTDFVVHWPRSTEPYAGDLMAFESAVVPVLQAQTP